MRCRCKIAQIFTPFYDLCTLENKYFFFLLNYIDRNARTDYNREKTEYTPLEFFTSVLADGFSLEFERLEETCCHSNSREKPSANIDVKNSKGVNNNNRKKQWNMNVTAMPIVIWALGSVTKGLVHGRENFVERE